MINRRKMFKKRVFRCPQKSGNPTLIGKMIWKKRLIMRFEIVLQRWQNYTNIAPFTRALVVIRNRLSGAQTLENSISTLKLNG